MNIRHRFNYAAFVVALYASFEKYIENLVAAYAQLAARRIPYIDLPPKLKDKHLLQTASLLSRSDARASRHPGLGELELVKNLFNCLGGSKSYTLNESAVIAHIANLRSDEIDKLFAGVGIESICSRVRRADAMLEWYRASNGPADALQDGVPSTSIEERIKEIVERRNEVAHRGGNPDDLLGVKQMFDAVDFIEAFSKSVFSIVVGRYFQVYYAKSGRRIQLQQRQNDGPYKNGKVVIVKKVAKRLFVGQPVFVIIEATGARWGRIQTIHVSDTIVQTFEPNSTAPNGIGIGLDFKCPEGAALTALMVNDDLVWA